MAVNETEVSLDLDENLPVGEEVSIRAESAMLPSGLETTIVSKRKAVFVSSNNKRHLYLNCHTIH